MRKSATRLSTLVLCAASVVLAPALTPVKAEASSDHARKHHKHRKEVNRSPGTGARWSANQLGQIGGSFSQPSHTCFRAIDCDKWPPSIEDDPDRKASGVDH
jgi:hypothetical protein